MYDLTTGLLLWKFGDLILIVGGLLVSSTPELLSSFDFSVMCWKEEVGCSLEKGALAALMD